jgi:hypothetical protein
MSYEYSADKSAATVPPQYFDHFLIFKIKKS